MGPFYSPNEPRSRWSSIQKALIAFCPWAHRTVWCTTGQWIVHDSHLVWQADRCQPLVPWHTGQSGGTPILRYGLVTIGWAHVAPADRATDRCLSAQLAHRIVRWIIAAVPWLFPKSGLFTGCASLAPDNTVHRRLVQVWLDLAKHLHLNFSWFEKFPRT
jgi:hypothetical protein